MSTHREAVEAAVVSYLDSLPVTLFGRAWDLSQDKSREECIEWITGVLVDVESILYLDDAFNLERSKAAAVERGEVDPGFGVDENRGGWWAALASMAARRAAGIS